jgi:hypothetical protein
MKTLEKILLIVLTCLTVRVSVNAGESAGHQIIIRIIRPNVFFVNEAGSFTDAKTDKKENALKFNWNSSSLSKKITVSDLDGNNAPLFMQGSEGVGRPIRINQIPKAILTNVTRGGGSATLKYWSNTPAGRSQNETRRLLCTVVDF